VGYSKLGKAALISKLAELTTSSLPPSSVHNTRPKADASFSTSGPPLFHVDDPPALAGAGPGHTGPPSLPILRGGNMVSVGTHIVPQNSVTSDAFQPPSCLSGGRGTKHSPSVAAAHSTAISKRGQSEISQGQAYHDHPLAKRPRVATPSSVQAAAGEAALRPPNSTRLPGDRCVPDPPLSDSRDSALVPPINEELGLGRQLDSQTHIVSMSRNRFKPLTMITRPPPVMLHNRNGAQPSSGSLVDGSAEVMAQPTLLWHLDFPAPTVPPLLSAITYPPPLSQRKLIQRWVIILSGLSSKERLQCCSVSRLIRYAGKRGWLNMWRACAYTLTLAVYSSAYYKLYRDFSGPRLSLVSQRCGSVTMMNFWPYLLQREREASERKNTVMGSFLRPVFQGPVDIISARLWSSPENEKQLTVALRFASRF
jgi:hypothetical protein